MKNLKMAFTAVAVFALVGSALAITKYGAGNRFCRSVANDPTTCSMQPDYTTLNPQFQRWCGTTLQQCQTAPVLTTVRLIGE